jgi:two-component system sensor histidine kinase HydH
MSRTRHAPLPLAALTRWGALAAAVLMATALFATAWSTHVGVRDSLDMLARGQGDLLRRELRLHLAGLGRRPTATDLDDVLTELSPDGLRYLAMLGPDRRITADAGEASGGRASVERAAAGVRGRGATTRVGERIRILLRTGHHRPGRRLRRFHRRDFDGLVLEYQPVIADALRDRSRRTLAIGAVASGAFLVLALALGRWLLRRERLERTRERDRRLASLGEMSAVLAHEIRNPLASLKGNAQLLAGMLPEGERPRVKADRVVTESVRLETLTRDLLEFVRTGELEPDAIDPAALLDECARAVDQEIAITTTGAPPTARLDPRRMRQVLINLLENAVQAGGPVHAEVAATPQKLTFTIRDHGPGLPAGQEQRLFEPFFTQRTQGTGLGLAVARRLVELHGGRITAANAEGGGAEFRVTLPLA